jgi:hypothetical protein
MQLEILKNILLILEQDIQLCLSIIIKWNKIYTSSNTIILYFINLNNGDCFLPMKAIT